MNVSEWNSLDDIWNHMESYEYPWDIDDTSIYGCIMDVIRLRPCSSVPSKLSELVLRGQTRRPRCEAPRWLL